MRNSTPPTLDNLKQQLEKKDASQIEFAFKLLFPLTEISANSTSNPANICDCLALIEGLAAQVVLNSYQARKKNLSKEDRQSLFTKVSTHNKELKQKLITLARISYSIAEPLLQYYSDYLTAISSAKLSSVEIFLAKAVGVDLRKGQEDARASSLELLGIFQKPVAVSESSEAEAHACAAHSKDTVHLLKM